MPATSGDTDVPGTSPYCKENQKRPFDFNDLVQEALCALLRAVETFDPSKGKFSPYAYQEILTAIIRFVRKAASPIHISEGMSQKIAMMRRKETELISQKGVPPTDEELARRLNTSAKEIRTRKMVAEMATSPISLERPIDKEKGVLVEVIPNQKAPEPSKETETRSLQKVVEEALEKGLSPEEEAILRLRFGLQFGPHPRGPLSYEEIGKRFGLSKQRVGNIIERALEKLREDPKLTELFKDLI